MLSNLPDIAIQFALVFVGFMLFFFVGKFFLKLFSNNHFQNKYEAIFYPFVLGLLLVVSLYTIIMTKGLTIQIFMLPLLFFICRENGNVENKTSSKFSIPVFELAFIALISIVILHLFPESEYKQADSFFYLKIAESLNATGQENISHYYNGLSEIYHGVEPYHYFEIWVTSFFIQFTSGISSHIATERFVTHGILLAGIITGLYFIIEVLNKGKVKWYQKLFCFSLLFFLPNILNYFPSFYNYFISDFEGNLLDRPNFRIIYLLLIPVAVEFLHHRKLTSHAFYFLLILSVSTFAVAVVIIPSLVAFAILQKIFLKEKTFTFFWPSLIIFSLAFAGFYYFFGVKNLPGLFHVDATRFISDTLTGWKFILFSSVMSAVYILLIAAFFLLPIFFLYYNKNEKKNVSALLLFAITSIFGLIIARVFFLKDNAYQFLFFTHLLVTFIIWLLYAYALVKQPSAYKWLGATVFLSCLFFIKVVIYPETNWNTFQQNGNFVYGGKKYSEDYIEKVRSFFKQSPGVQGAYIAGKNFYEETYYSRRNPNVYFLPITYIMSSSVNNNIEYCISDSSDIMIGIENSVLVNYLQNAIVRSVYYQFSISRIDSSISDKQAAFIKQNHLRYLIATADAEISPAIQEMVKSSWEDTNTGEQFFLLFDPR